MSFSLCKRELVVCPPHKSIKVNSPITLQGKRLCPTRVFAFTASVDLLTAPWSSAVSVT